MNCVAAARIAEQIEPGETALQAAEDEAARQQTLTGRPPTPEAFMAMALAAQRALNRDRVRRSDTLRWRTKR